ncbi:MAG: UDP-N-acetylmuramoyl-tripeptide--D-alanyl-D-alanine ligase [Chloroflexia bacterium]
MLSEMFTLDDVIQGTGGQLDGAPTPDLLRLTFHGAAIDSRKTLDEALFVALKGERVDGHDYVLEAARHGARSALVRHDWQPPDALLTPVGAPHAAPSPFPLVRVEDPLSALQRFAGWWRARHSVQVIGITGSVGKTSAKELTASVLSRRFDTLKNEGNLNNEVGLPLTLLNLTGIHQKAVLEMGAGYAFGELTLLCELARPEIAIELNVHPVHAERLGTLENIALNKSELVRALPASGTALLNGDDPLVREMRAVTPARVLHYGLSPEHDLYATSIESRGLQGVNFTLHFNPTGEQWQVKLPLLGRHSVYAALAAAGAAHAAGMTWDDIIDALQTVEARARLLVVPGRNGSTLIDDTYNASPASTLAALDLLHEMEGRHIAVLGDMRELGTYELEGHLQVGRKVPSVAEVLVLVGALGRLIGEEAIRSGMVPERVFFTATNGQAIDYLRGLLHPGDYALIKGSRGLSMEEIVDGLKA